jgi:hypothetical protein
MSQSKLVQVVKIIDLIHSILLWSQVSATCCDGKLLLTTLAMPLLVYLSTLFLSTSGSSLKIP